MPGLDITDFKDQKNDAEKWGEKHFKDWNQHLQQNEVQELKHYLQGQVAWKIRSYLEQRQGNLFENFPPNMDASLKERVVTMNDTIKTVDKALQKVKTPETIFVYQESNIALEFEDEQSYKQSDNDLKFDDEKLKKLIEEYQNKTVPKYNFLRTFLAKESVPLNDILLKIEVPKGTHAAFVGHNIYPTELYKNIKKPIILIARQHNLQYKKFTIFNHGARQILKIEATLKLPE